LPSLDVQSAFALIRLSLQQYPQSATQSGDRVHVFSKPKLAIAEVKPRDISEELFHILDIGRHRAHPLRKKICWLELSRSDPHQGLYIGRTSSPGDRGEREGRVNLTFDDLK
jgi:hypothetical protein